MNIPKGLILVQRGRKFYTLNPCYELGNYDTKKLREIINNNKVLLLKDEVVKK